MPGGMDLSALRFANMVSANDGNLANIRKEGSR